MLSLRSLGSRIVAERTARGLSREKLARLVADLGQETSASTILYLEQAKGRSADLFLVAAIARALDVEMYRLIGETSPTPSTSEPLVDRFRILATEMPPAELELHLRALELLAEERKKKEKPKGAKKAAA